MKRYRFRFEHVARVRQIQEEQARADLLLARQRLIQAGADLASRANQYEARRSRTERSSSSQFRSDHDRDDLLSMAVIAARSAEANAQLLFGQQLDAWTEAARKVSAMERLDERMREQHAIEEAREEQAEMDDLVSPRQAARKREDP
ncbi:MAG: flagellar FliJ family protein [Acidimicrobiales bacterium]